MTFVICPSLRNFAIPGCDFSQLTNFQFGRLMGHSNSTAQFAIDLDGNGHQLFEFKARVIVQATGVMNAVLAICHLPTTFRGKRCIRRQDFAKGTQFLLCYPRSSSFDSAKSWSLFSVSIICAMAVLYLNETVSSATSLPSRLMAALTRDPDS